ncbi:hypothetical protein KM043_016905 [Ampulex compressa]|nr:hypothetical protein KM043_016905 [Ampulex compressa]
MTGSTSRTLLKTLKETGVRKRLLVRLEEVLKETNYKMRMGGHEKINGKSKMRKDEHRRKRKQGKDVERNGTMELPKKKEIGTERRELKGDKVEGGKRKKKCGLVTEREKYCIKEEKVFKYLDFQIFTFCKEMKEGTTIVQKRVVEPEDTINRLGEQCTCTAEALANRRETAASPHQVGLTELKDLRIARGQIKAMVTRAQRFVQDVDLENINIDQLTARREGLANKLDDFYAIQRKLQVLDDSVDYESETEAFEKTYYGLISSINGLLRSQGGSSRSSPLQSSGENTNDRAIRLPKIELPLFNGEYEQWYPFRDMFHSLIHGNSSLPSIQKFQYLKSSLKGEAAQVIHSLEISEANYPEAWKMLTSRYDNKRLIVHTHLRSIMELPSLAKENSAGLRQILDGALKHTRALKAMGRPVGYWDDCLVHIVAGKLDPITYKEWESTLSQSSLPSFSQLTEFLSHRCQVLEAVLHKAAPSAFSSSKPSLQRQKTVSHVVTGPVSCQICQDSHYIHQCDKFRSMPVHQRIKEVRGLGLCLNCLRSTAHYAQACNSIGCRKCHKKHNTLLHIEAKPVAQRLSSPVAESSAQAERKHESVVANISREGHVSATSQVFLSTALIDVYDRRGRTITARALLDSGSQSCFITEGFAERLNLKLRRHDTPVTGINQAMALAHHSVSIKFKSRYNRFNRTVNCVVLKGITQNLPLISIPKGAYQIPGGIKLADPNFSQSSGIDILLGAEIFFEVLCVGQIKAGVSHPCLQKSHLGWIVSGSVRKEYTQNQAVSCNLATQDLSMMLAKFWELDQCLGNTAHTKEEAECEALFKSSYKRDEQGRFVVKLPFKSEKLSQLGESRNVALKRFHNLERKLNRQPSLKKEYSQFIREYRELGHMRLVPEEGMSRAVAAYYMPHHAVVKQSRLTTRIRVVFDTSCKSPSGISLNDALMVGPTLQQDLMSILARFRIFAYVLMGDLPSYRITPSRPFARTGVDYCGPFYVKEGRRRNAKVSKAYAAIFIFVCTKAIHIELVADMTTESFLGCLKRFISRRGKPAHIYSDNGSNFVGANRELRELTAAVFSRDGQERVANCLNVEGVDWHFIPPRAPHFGGLWEAAVKPKCPHSRSFPNRGIDDNNRRT